MIKGRPIIDHNFPWMGIPQAGGGVPETDPQRGFHAHTLRPYKMAATIMEWLRFARHGVT